MLHWNQAHHTSASPDSTETETQSQSPGPVSLSAAQKRSDALVIGFIMGVALATGSLTWIGAPEPLGPTQSRSDGTSQAAPPLPLVIEPITPLEALKSDHDSTRSPGSIRNESKTRTRPSPLRAIREHP